MSQEKYIGMDVHQATISVAVMDAPGKLIMECLLTRNPGTKSGEIRGQTGGVHPCCETKKLGTVLFAERL